MTAREIAQLAIVLAPVAKEIVIEGGKLVAEFKEQLSPEDMTKALELSKSDNWPKIDFTRQKG